MYTTEHRVSLVLQHERNEYMVYNNKGKVGTYPHVGSHGVGTQDAWPTKLVLVPVNHGVGTYNTPMGRELIDNTTFQQNQHTSYISSFKIHFHLFSFHSYATRVRQES